MQPLSFLLSRSSPRPLIAFSSSPERKGGRGGEGSQRSGARLTLSLSPSRPTAGQEDLEDAQQEVHGRGGEAVAARLRASEPRHAAARAALRCSPRSPLASWRPGLLAPGPPPRRLPRPAPRRVASAPAAAAAAAAAAAGQPRARRSLRACAPQIGRDGARRGAGNVDNAKAAAAAPPGSEHMAAGPPRGALRLPPHEAAGPGHVPRA